MTRSVVRRRTPALALLTPALALLTVALVGAVGAPPAAAQGRPPVPRAQCALCHGELELLRRHSATLDDARSLVVTDADIRASAHDTLSCASCHTGFGRYPHRVEATEGTRACTDCHEAQHGEWSDGIHAVTPVGEGAPAARCEDCHGAHDVLRADTASRRVRARLDGACVECHATSALPRNDPHADTVTCSSCHTAHATKLVDSRESNVAPLVQPRTCGQCHAEVGDSVPHDVHGRALAGMRTPPALSHLRDRDDLPPTCTSCHGAHGMRAPSHADFAAEMVEACSACHQDYAETYFGTYHGKATALGSEIAATCDGCHGAHAIMPADDPHSRVSEERLISTCQDCHEEADAQFALYDSHPDPMDRDRNPPLFFSFVFMNTLLYGVLGVFTLHTALWWLRLWLDRRKGVTHGGGGDHV